MKTTGFKISKPKMASKQSNDFNFAKFQHSLHLVNQCHLSKPSLE